METELEEGLKKWAYIARIRVSKSTISKRAVVRNRAKRRIRAAANQIMPLHAKRWKEYALLVKPEALTIQWEDLVDEMIRAVKSIDCWCEELDEQAWKRPKY